MAFTVNDLQDLIVLLAEKPEWRAQLRPLILGDDFERMPTILQELAEAQRRTEARVEELAAAQQRTETRVEELAATVTRLGEKIDRLADVVSALTARVRDSEVRLDAWDGYWSESLFRRRVRDYFGELVRRARVVTLEEAGADDAFDRGAITEQELAELDALDFLVEGKQKSDPQLNVFLAVEISRSIDNNDVERAARRAAILEKAGLSARGVVGLARIDERVKKLADERNVYVRVVSAAEMPA